jgi:hypothetical protein
VNDGVVLLLLSIVGFIVLIALTTGWALSMQRSGLKKQSAAISAVDESMALTREGMTLARRNAEMLARLVALAELTATQQAEVVRLLTVITARTGGEGSVAPGTSTAE